MKISLKLKLTHILITSAIIMIYFQIYWHYWFVKLLGGYVVNTLLPIMLLFFVFIIREFVSHDTNRIKKRKIYYLLILLFYYFLFASASILLNEQGFKNIKSYFIYIYSPVLLFVSILGLYLYRKIENIKFTLNVLFILSVIFSIYVTITYSVDPLSVSEFPVLETNRGDVKADTGAAFGVRDLSMIRYTIPGISSTTYGPLLVLLIFVGLYFRKNVGKLRYLYFCAVLFLIFCVFMTVSRGPLVSLIAGMIYLTWWRWFKLKEVVFATLILIISIFTFAKLSFLRLIITFAAFIPIDVPYLGDDVQNLIIEDPRRMSIKETLSYIYQHPFWGMGMSNLINVQDSSYGKEHNNYLSIAASFGIPTLIFYILFVILLFIMIHRNIEKLSRNTSMRDMGITFGAGIFALIIYLNFAPAEFHFIWIWFGLAAAWLRNCEDGFLFKKPATYKLCIEKI